MQRYQRRLSGPLRDRFDLAIDLPALSWAEMCGREAAEGSAVVRERVLSARSRQMARQGRLNGRLDGRLRERHCRLGDPRTEVLLGRAVARFALSARAMSRVLRVARTIADIDAAEAVAERHVAEALQFRLVDNPPAG